MTSFFPDLNIWLALSDAGNFHHSKAWIWFNLLPTDARLLFSQYTQLGLLRLLTNQSVMGEQTLVLKDAWAVYDHWLDDSRVEFTAAVRRHEWRRGTQKCVRYVWREHLPMRTHSTSMSV